MKTNNVFENVLESIGNTPLIRMNRVNPNPKVVLYAKIEARNPGGSIKDRAALSMIEAAEREGQLHPGKIIIEATSGNTGIGLAIVAAVKGYRVVLAMPETASLERQKTLKALGAELLLTPGALGTDGAIEEVYNLVRENPDRYFMADQFNNPANPEAHRLGTGPEIFEQTGGAVDVIVATLGTTGTAMGVLQAVRERNASTRVVAVEPYPGHKVQGLKNMKESYVPGIFDRHALDAVVHVKDEDAFEMARRLAREEGIFVGMSSGAAMAAAVKIASELESGTVVAVLPDGGDRYLSTNLFTTMLEPDFRFFNLLTREKVDFKPVKEGKARICVTGPTLDRPISVQDARRFVLADVLSRFFQAKQFSVDQIILIPDLDSRTISGALAAGLDHAAYAQRQVDTLTADFDLLGIQRAYRYPRTSEHVDTIVEFTRRLMEKDLAYEKLRSVYFNLSKSRDYGALSKVNLEKIRHGASVDLNAYEKLNPQDFALLKRATLAELKRGICVKSDWGNVIPTWHIAAASVAIHDFGTPIDVLVSSMDFVFPHLENVRQIGEALTGKPFANTWMLTERAWSAKEDKGLSHFDEDTPVRKLTGMGYSPMEVRYWLLSTHYRKPIHVTVENLANAVGGFRRIREFIGRIRYTGNGAEADRTVAEMAAVLEQEFFDSLADDLNFPKALAVLFTFIRNVNPILDRSEMAESQRRQVFETFQKLNGVLGVFDLELRPLDSAEEELIRSREAARISRNWGEADLIRQDLLCRGIKVIDTSTGTRWQRCEPECIKRAEGQCNVAKCPDK